MIVCTIRLGLAIHLLGNSTDLRFKQALKGYSSSKTTEIKIYFTTKVSIRKKVRWKSWIFL